MYNNIGGLKYYRLMVHNTVQPTLPGRRREPKRLCRRAEGPGSQGVFGPPRESEGGDNQAPVFEWPKERTDPLPTSGETRPKSSADRSPGRGNEVGCRRKSKLRPTLYQAPGTAGPVRQPPSASTQFGRGRGTSCVSSASATQPTRRRSATKRVTAVHGQPNHCSE